MTSRRSPIKWLAGGAALLLVYQARIVRGQVGESRLLPAPGARVVTLTPPMDGYNSPAIAVNPFHPDQLVAAFEPMSRASYSADSGANWSLEQRTAGPGSSLAYGDTSAVYDRNGYAIMCFNAFDGAGPFKYWGNNPKRNGVFIRRSPDGGRTWEPKSISVVEQPGGPGSAFEDQPYIVADAQPTSPFAGNLYVAWSQDGLENALIMLSRSTDGGLTWSPPLRVSDKAGLPRDDNGTVEGVRGSVAPDGSLHLVWSEFSHLVYAVSRDGGKTFSRNRQIVEGGPFHFHAFNLSEANGYPMIGIQGHGKGARPDIYVAWSDFRNGDVDVFCISSHDGGNRWSAPVRVNNDTLHNNADQLFQSLAIDSASGAINVLFYDRRRDPSNRSVDVVLARSTDHGATFKNYLLSDRAFDPAGGVLGEYTGLAAADGRVYGIWTAILGADEAPAQSKRPTGTAVIRVGMADFGRPGNSEDSHAQH